ncbi:MAG: DNA repair protein RecN, partial [Actinobacteria bacterium]|nr:DNA repair protein RecN [Actinomycetota bacterium]
MIEEIRIRDLGVISEAALPLGPGFTAITGETGAGKTMVVTALGLLRGERADAATVRRGSDALWVEGTWRLENPDAIRATVEEAGGAIDGSELLIARSVSSEGLSRAVVGGRTTPAGVLQSLADALVAVHGQSDQIRLRSATEQRESLDRYAGASLATALSEYQQAFRRWQKNAAELAELTTERDRRQREADDLRASLSDIESIAPQVGEDVELQELAERMTNVEDLRVAIAAAHSAISSDDDSSDAIGAVENARRQIERVSAVDPVLAKIGETLVQLSAQLAEVSTDLSRRLADIEVDGERSLDAVQDRRAQLANLMRRFGPTLDEVLAFADSGSARLLALDGDSERIDELTVLAGADALEVKNLGASLTAVREGSALELSASVTTELAGLSMPDSSLHVRVTALDEPTLHGYDAVEFLLKPHAGSDPRPIAKGASGGELSRVMLALEVVVAERDRVPTYVFDEVDSGVGGAAAIEIGRRLARLAQNAQVIVVTHLAQVAAFATNHLRVEKNTDGDVTVSSVVKLEGEERIAEMARLLSGLPDSDTGLEHAREL